MVQNPRKPATRATVWLLVSGLVLRNTVQPLIFPHFSSSNFWSNQRRDEPILGHPWSFDFRASLIDQPPNFFSSSLNDGRQGFSENPLLFLLFLLKGAFMVAVRHVPLSLLCFNDFMVIRDFECEDWMGDWCPIWVCPKTSNRLGQRFGHGVFLL